MYRSSTLFACRACRTSLLESFLDDTIPYARRQAFGSKLSSRTPRQGHYGPSRRLFSSVSVRRRFARATPSEQDQAAEGEIVPPLNPTPATQQRQEFFEQSSAELSSALEQLDDGGARPDDPRPGAQHESSPVEELESSTQADGEGQLASLRSPVQLEGEGDSDFKARKQLFSDIVGAMQHNEELDRAARERDEVLDEDEDEEADPREQDPEYLAAIEYMDNPFGSTEPGHSRTHPLTKTGRFSTSPSTILLPRWTMVEPIKRMLGEVPNKHLDETAVRIFGGPHLPNSTATPSTKGGHLKQQPIALDPSQGRMSSIQASVYLAAIMPGAYASIMSVLVETRKRLGSDWLQGLLKKNEGPRILDAGAAGAGVLAWQEVLRAEWEGMNPSAPESSDVPFGKSATVTASSELRMRMSALLDNTTFLPRLPDFAPRQHLPNVSNQDPGTRRQYDVIIAPYTLWNFREDYMRKAHVQNLWTLLNPDGGVLILLEKGVPRGFELIAGARDTLLKHHIASPGAEHIENNIADTTKPHYIPKEEGMIVAPCTNHSTCPMYPKKGEMKARKDYCHFQQRYERPPYLQRLLGKSFRNHEDIRFSYLAVRRGRDGRRAANVAQDEGATLAAFAGFEAESEAPPSPLALPRTMLRPIKRHKHVVFDVCTPAARIERWTVSASFSKQAYRDARKAQWGDLWALGAKSRVVRRVRDGMPKDMPRRRVIEVGVGDVEEQDTLRDMSKGYRGITRGYGVRREQRLRRVSEKEMI